MLEIVKTADGSNTIFNAEVGEHYHSKHGAVQESRHVFIHSGLNYFLERIPAPSNPIAIGPPSPTDKKVSPLASGGDIERASISILEVGFGTGLNFLLSAEACAEKGIGLNYTGIEAYSLSLEMISQTGYDQYLSSNTWKSFIEKYMDSLAGEVAINPHCKLQIANCKLSDFQSKQPYDIIYFDAFAAAYQPEMWNETAIGHTVQFLKPGAVFVTYAITGNLKRILKALGCKVEKAPGAPGKREMLRAAKLEL